MAPNSTDHTAASPSGMVGYWAQESNSVTESSPDLRQIELNASRLTILFRSSLELVEDGISFEQQISRSLSEGIGDYLDRAFIRGDGQNKPQGILNAAAKIAQDAESSQVASTLVSENIAKMWSRMWPAGRRRCAWLMNSDVIPQLYLMTQDAGTAGFPVYMPGGNIAGQPFATLYGRPIYWSEHCSALGSEGDVILVDPGAYGVGIVGNSLRLSFSDHRHFENAQRLWRAYVRVAGQCLVESAITPAQSSVTVGPIVTLADRS